MEKNEKSIRALEGTRILDLSRLNPGGYCTMLLADLGAEVLKIEQPGIGDYIRTVPPLIDGKSAMFLGLNRNKKSLTLNLKSDRGKEIFHKLLEKFDIVIESFRPGVTKRLGIDYETISKSHPEIIYCSLTGFGQDGPYRDIVGHDINYLGLSGILSLTGKKDGPPIVPGIPIADIAGSMFSTIAILSSIVDRQKTGKGQYMDVSMFDGIVSWLTIQAARFFAEKKTPERETFPAGGEFFYTTYETKDGKYVAVGAVEDKFWRTLCKGICAPELIEYKTTRDQNESEVKEKLSKIFRTKTRDEWFKILMNVDACLTPVKSLDEVFDDPHLNYRKLVFEIDSPKLRSIQQLAFPIKFSRTKPVVKHAPPDMGQNTESVLSELGYNINEIKALRKEGVV